LERLGHEVLAIDRDGARVTAISDLVTHAVQVDGTDQETLEELGVKDFDAMIIALSGNLEASILATMVAKRLHVRYVIAKAASDIHAQILHKLGVDRVVFPEQEMGQQLAHTFAARAVLDYLDVAPGYGIGRLGPQADFIGKTLEEIDLRGRFGLTPLALRRGGQVILNPHRSEIMGPEDELVVAGKDEQLEALSG
jgi:trk system potassium uptake protein TrkA